MSPGARAATSRTSGGWPKAPSGASGHLQLKRQVLEVFIHDGRGGSLEAECSSVAPKTVVR
jgi:hypothetical protein